MKMWKKRSYEIYTKELNEAAVTLGYSVPEVAKSLDINAH